MSADARFRGRPPRLDREFAQGPRRHRRGDRRARLLSPCSRSGPRRPPRALPAGRGYGRSRRTTGRPTSQRPRQVRRHRRRRHLHQLRRLRRQRGRRLVTSFESTRAATDWAPIVRPRPGNRRRPRELSLPRLLRRRQTSFFYYINGDPRLRRRAPGTQKPLRRDPDGTKHVLTFGRPRSAGGSRRPPRTRRLERSLDRHVRLLSDPPLPSTSGSDSSRCHQRLHQSRRATTTSARLVLPKNRLANSAGRSARRASARA